MVTHARSTTEKKINRESLGIILLIFLIGLSKIFFVSAYPSLFDTPEYVELSKKPFIEAFALGHRPSHPGYMAILWLVSQLFSPTHLNLVFIGGILSTFSIALSACIFYVLLRRLGLGAHALGASVIFLFLPLVGLLGATLSIEPVALLFFALSFLLFVFSWEKSHSKVWIWASVFLGFCLTVHAQFIFWIPLFFLLLFQKRKSFHRRKRRLAQCIVTGILIAVSIYALAYVMAYNRTNESFEAFIGFGNQGSYSDFSFPWGILRFVRVVGITTSRDYTPLFLLSMGIFYWKKRQEIGKFLLPTMVVGIPTIISLSFYSADFPGRRALPLACIAALLLAYIFSNRKKWLVIVYIISVTLPVLFLGSWLSADHHPIASSESLQKALTANGLYIHSHYTRPFIIYNGDRLSINEPGYSQGDAFHRIDSYLRQGKPVYLESQAVFDPYLFYAGNTLNTLSLGKFGKSDASAIFARYYVGLASQTHDGAKRIYVYELLANDEHLPVGGGLRIEGKASPGMPVYVYSDRIGDRILHQRQDYFDLFTWVWVLLSQRHEPIMYTYGDKDGTFELPLPRNLIGHVYIDGAQEYKFIDNQ